MLGEKQSRRKKIIKFRCHAVTDKNIEQQELVPTNVTLNYPFHVTYWSSFTTKKRKSTLAHA